MLQLFKKLIGSARDPAPLTAPVPSNPVASPPLDSNLPDPAGELSDEPDTQLVCRETILDRQERIAGYEFTLQEKLRSRLLEKSDLLQKVYDDALLRNLCALNTESLVGKRLALVRLCPASLHNSLIGKLPQKNTVIIISPTNQSFDRAEVGSQIDRLRNAGIAHGWVLRRPQLVQRPELLELAASGDFIEIKTNGFDGIELRTLVRELRQTHGGEDKRAAQLIARELATVEDFQLCYQSGFSYFHGPFVTLRDNWKAPPSEHNRVHLLEILNLIRGEAEFGVIAGHLKREPVLSFKLLRYLNSPATGLSSPVTTITQALTILGREKFYRWLSLLLFDVQSAGYRERILTEQALARARFLEHLAGQGTIPDARDALFLLGLFSLIDLLLGRPLDEIIRQAKLPSPVEEALLGSSGPWHDALQLAIAAQENDTLATIGAATRCAVPEIAVLAATIDALTWAAEITTQDNPPR